MTPVLPHLSAPGLAGGHSPSPSPQGGATRRWGWDPDFIDSSWGCNTWHKRCCGSRKRSDTLPWLATNHRAYSCLWCTLYGYTIPTDLQPEDVAIRATGLLLTTSVFIPIKQVIEVFSSCLIPQRRPSLDCCSRAWQGGSKGYQREVSILRSATTNRGNDTTNRGNDTTNWGNPGTEMPLIIIRSGTVTRYAGSVLPASTNLLSGGGSSCVQQRPAPPRPRRRSLAAQPRRRPGPGYCGRCSSSVASSRMRRSGWSRESSSSSGG
jgi:hypothetical protein